MIHWKVLERPAFEVIGRKTWIAGIENNDAFGRFWDQCRREGLFSTFEQLSGFQPGTQTQGVTLGVSCVEKDPANREFYYMIAIEKPVGQILANLECYPIPASLWAVFECRGPVPEAIVESEIYAFTQWLPASGYVHALAPEMEVYPPVSGENNEPDHYCEFWLPIVKP
jgi:AraC family transcriptional regulator